MKKRVVSALIVLMFLVGGLVVFLAYTSKKMSKYEITSAEVLKLTVFIQEFESANGKYPNSISELESNLDEVERSVVIDIIQSKWDNQYEYRALKDCVQINVRGYHFTCNGVVNGFEIRGDFTTNVMTVTGKNEADKSVAPPMVPSK